MEKTGDILNRAGSVMRDVFNYIVPAIPFVIFAVPLLENIGLLNLGDMEGRLSFLDQSGIREIALFVIIYMVGRLLNALSYPIFFLFEKTIGRIKFPWIVEYSAAYELVKDCNDYALYAKALRNGGEIYNLFFERTTMILMSERSLGTMFFLVGILLVISALSPSPLLSNVLTWVYIILSFGMSILFYFMHVGSATELHSAAKATLELPDSFPPAPRP